MTALTVFGHEGEFGRTMVAAIADVCARRGVELTVVLPGNGPPAGVEPIDAHEFAGPVRVQRVSDVNDCCIRPEPDGSAVCVGFDQIFGAELIESFARFVNVHPSILPAYRGPMPTWWCLEKREERTGFTIHRVVEEVDAGPIVAQGLVPIAPHDTLEMLDTRVATAAASVLCALLDSWFDGTAFVGERYDPSCVYLDPLDYAPDPARGTTPRAQG